MTSEFKYAADIAVPGARWYDCVACGNGLVDFRSCYFDCERCGAKNVTVHICPKNHDHPMNADPGHHDISGDNWMRTSENVWNYRLER